MFRTKEKNYNQDVMKWMIEQVESEAAAGTYQHRAGKMQGAIPRSIEGPGTDSAGKVLPHATGTLGAIAEGRRSRGS